GAHIARAFLAHGAKVIVNYLNSASAANDLVSTAAPGQALAIQADVSDAAAVQAMFERARTHFGQPVTTVVNNALPAFSFNGDAREHADTLRWESIAQQMEGVVRGALNTTQIALPGMKPAGFGRIINI